MHFFVKKLKPLNRDLFKIINAMAAPDLDWKHKNVAYDLAVVVVPELCRACKDRREPRPPMGPSCGREGAPADSNPAINVAVVALDFGCGCEGV